MLQSILHFFQSLYDRRGLQELIRWGGAPLVCFIVFIETGLFVGFFLPGDSLLITAGIFAAAGVVPSTLASTAGDGVRDRWRSARLLDWAQARGPRFIGRKIRCFFRRSHLATCS